MSKGYLIIVLILLAIGWPLIKYIRLKMHGTSPIDDRLLWECPKCKDRNYSGNIKCGNCGAKRPREFRVFDEQGLEVTNGWLKKTKTKETRADFLKILTFKIFFDSQRNVAVDIKPIVLEMSQSEYIRLWACYEAKIIYSLGFPHNMSAMMALGSIAKVVEKNISPDTDCFASADVDDVISFAREIPVKHSIFTGEFYAKGGFERMVITHFPIKGTEQQVVYSGLALLQYVIDSINRDDEMLHVLTKTARIMLALYETEMAIGVESVYQIPNLAYLKACKML
jgi:hypothetical protein